MADAQIVAALDAIQRAGLCDELETRIADAWAAERERKLQGSIGQGMKLEIELRRLLKFSSDQARAAVNSFCNKSYSEVAAEVLIDFAEEIKVPPATIAFDAAVNVPPAIRRATEHAIAHRIKVGRAAR